jgi:ElaB/YqjD/DUF883 family membrane-anchored ribosome-binding protein
VFRAGNNVGALWLVHVRTGDDKNEERDMQQTGPTGNEWRGRSNTVASQASDAANRMGDRVEQGVDQAKAAIATAQERGREIAADTSEMIGEYRSTIEDSVRAQPLLALGVAAFAGFLIGGFWGGFWRSGTR